MTAERDYQPMLRHAENLQYLSGYLSPQDLQRQRQTLEAFRQRRREFVYELVRSGEPADTLIPTVAQDLDAIEATSEYHPGAIEFLREELDRHIAKQLGSNPLQRFVTRWGVPTLGVLGVIAYAWARYAGG